MDFNIDPYGDLHHIDASSQCKLILDLCYSKKVQKAVARWPCARILRDRLLVSLFHINLKPSLDMSNQPNYTHISSAYPYDPVYQDPFPRRPTIEVIAEAIRFMGIIDADNPQTTEPLHIFLTESYQLLELSRRPSAFRIADAPIPIRTIIQNPVDSYIALRKRLVNGGESASFPEFAYTVSYLIAELNNETGSSAGDIDPIYQNEVIEALRRLKEVQNVSGIGTVTEAPFYAPYPYRRTITAIEFAVSVFDMRERCRYPESADWYDVETSWAFSNQKRLLLPLYHFSRYKYQQFGLLANPHVILLPIVAESSMEDLLRLRPVPMCIIGVNTNTIRVDRHHNTPLDFWYHDVNHSRRQWGYDKRLISERGLVSDTALINDMRERQQFIEMLLQATDPLLAKNSHDAQIRKLQRYIIFETFHETALPATKEALMNDIFRKPAVPQPFEVMRQRDQTYFKELNRQFDGNLKSGAGNITLNLNEPTIVEYFFDRAPSFLSNVYNKLAWGFHGCVFQERQSANKLRYRTPYHIADAILQLAGVLDISTLPTKDELISDIEDRSGQPELYNYFALHPEMDISAQVRERGCHKSLTASDIQQARLLKSLNPTISPSDISKITKASDEHRQLIGWMKTELRRYEEQFDTWFRLKLQRANQVNFYDGHDFVQKFVGPEKQKVLKAFPSSDKLKELDVGGSMFIDTWAVPFFNSAVQTIEQARDGIRKAINTFDRADMSTLTLYDMTRLIAIYARPEFDDIRRYKLQLFPTDAEVRMFGSERNDAKTIGDNFPEEGFVITNSTLDMDELSFSFGIRLHYLGLIKHDQLATADGRLFVGPADFLEHDMSHGYFTIILPPPGSDTNWTIIHEEYRRMQAQICIADERLLNSLVYFYFTHESGYKSMMSSDHLAYKNEIDVIAKRINTHRDFDWISSRLRSCTDMTKMLDKSFDKVTRLLASKIKWQ